MGKVIPIASSVNFGMNELSASYAVLTFNGIATAEAGTYLKSMLSELGTTGSKTDKALRELTGKGFAQLKAEGIPTAEVLNLLNQYAGDSGLTLKDMFGSVEAGTAALVLAAQNGEQYNEFLAKIEGSAGATQAAIDKLNADPAEQLKGSLNELKNAGIELGGAMTPAIGTVTEAVSGLAGAFSDMDEAQQSAVVNAGLVLIVLGPVMKLAGSGIQIFTKVASKVGGLNAALTKMAETAATAGAGSSALSSIASGILGPSLGTAAIAVGAISLHQK